MWGEIFKDSALTVGKNLLSTVVWKVKDAKSNHLIASNAGSIRADGVATLINATRDAIIADKTF